MSGYAYETKVYTWGMEPNAGEVLELLKTVDLGGTSLSEWTIGIEKKANEITHSMQTWQNRFRWEVTFTRRIK